jgi:hypothetical protein
MNARTAKDAIFNAYNKMNRAQSSITRASINIAVFGVDDEDARRFVNEAAIAAAEAHDILNAVYKEMQTNAIPRSV